MFLRALLGLLAVAAFIAAGQAEARGRRGGGGHHHHRGVSRVIVAPSFYGFGGGYYPYGGYYPAYGPYDYYYPGYPPPPYAAAPYPAFVAPAGTLVVVAPGSPPTDRELLLSPRDRGLP